MITLNEAHNMPDLFKNLEGFADEVFILDSFSTDKTVEIAIENGAKVYQRPFEGFGNQWNCALQELPMTAPWTMKLDPDERLSEELKISIKHAISKGHADGFSITRRLWFMGVALPIRQKILRIWKTGTCKFTNALVNEHPCVDGIIELLKGDLDHHDSPDLHHWVGKQNNYTSAEALSKFELHQHDLKPTLFGNPMQRRMWMKRHYDKLPFRHYLMFLYCYVFQGAWKAGKPGYIWARLRAEVYRMREYKLLEMQYLRRPIPLPKNSIGKPHSKAIQVKG